MESRIHINTVASKHGLPSDQVHAVAQDSEKRLWIASPAGLSRYDGLKIRVFDNQQGLQCQGLRTVEIQNDIVWIGTDQGIESIHTNGNSTHIIVPSDWTYGLVQSIVTDNDTIWLGCAYGLLKMHFEKENNSLIVEISENTGFVRAILLLDDKRVIAISGKGLIKHDGEKWEYISNESIPESAQILCLHKKNADSFLVGTADGLFILHNSGHTLYKIELPCKSKRVTAIAVSGKELWAGVGSELLLFKESPTGFDYISTYSLGSNINDIFVDQVNNIWIGTNSGGLKKISCLRDILTRIETGVPGAVYSIREAVDSKLQIGGETYFSNVSRLDSKEIANYEIQPNFPAMTVWDSFYSPKDEVLWLATQEGLFTLTNGSIEQFGKEKKIIKSPARCILQYKKDLFIGTLDGLARISDGEVTEIRGIDNSNLGYVYCLCHDNRFQMWVGTLGKGLWRESPQGLVAVLGGPLSKTANTYAVAPNPNGKVLVIQDEKIIIIEKNGEARLVLVEYPVAGWNASWLDETRVVIGSNNGLILVDVIANTILLRINPLLKKGDWQFTNNRALLVESEEKIFCGLNAGLYRINLKAISAYTEPPSIFVDEISWENASPNQKAQNYILKTGKWSVKASVYCAWFIAEELIQFRFMLIGFDRNWSDLKAQSGIKYNSLPPGNYELKAQVYTTLTGFGEPTTILKLKVLSPWWTFGLDNAIHTFSKVRDRFVLSKVRNAELINRNIKLELEVSERRVLEKQLRDYQNHLEQIVNERTNKLKEVNENLESFAYSVSHDLRSPLRAISGYSSILKSEYSKSLDDSGKSMLEIISSNTNKMDLLITDLLSLARISKMDLQKEKLNMEQMAKSIFEEMSTEKEKSEFIFELSEIPPANVDRAAIKQIWSNLISNALKYSSKSLTKKIEIGFKQGENNTIYFVRDYGVGFDEKYMDKIFQAFQRLHTETDFEGTGVGLAIVHRLITKHQGQIWANSKPNEGTCFYFSLPN